MQQTTFPIDLDASAPVQDPAVLLHSSFWSLTGRLVSSTCGVLSLCVVGFWACGHSGASEEDADRSMKQYELAIGLQGEGNTPGAFQALFKAIEVDPGNAKAHLLLGSMFLVSRDDNPAAYDANAEKHFREAQRIQESDQALPDASLAADAHNALGVLFINQKKYKDAVVELNAAVADLLNRDAYLAWGNLGWAYSELRNYPKAIDALLRAVRLQPHFCVGFYRLGDAYLKVKEPAKAEQALSQAIESDKRCGTFQDAWHLRGESRMQLGMRDDARGDFERCVELDPNTEAGKSCGRYLQATY